MDTRLWQMTQLTRLVFCKQFSIMTVEVVFDCHMEIFFSIFLLMV